MLGLQSRPRGRLGSPRGVQSLRAECNFFSNSGTATQKRRWIDDKFLVRRKLPRMKRH